MAASGMGLPAPVAAEAVDQRMAPSGGVPVEEVAKAENGRWPLVIGSR